MPIMSYLVYPVEGRSQELCRRLTQIPRCEVIKAVNSDVLILITDTESEKEDKKLSNKLEKISSLGGLALVSAYSDGLDRDGAIK